jgi:phosphomannomutase
MTKDFDSATSCWRAILADVTENRRLLSLIEDFARHNTSPSRIVFGTSGWRGEIGTDFTFNNVRVVTSAIIEMFRESDPRVMDAIGVRDFDEIERRGVIVGHDNRLLGKEFAMEVIGLLQKEGIRTWYGGEAATPEFSAGIEMLNAACSINLTPSHNPPNYGGLKFNPSDGGPAGTEVTGRIQEIANRMMDESLKVEPVEPRYIDKVDLTNLYIRYITEKRTLDLMRIQDFIKNEDCIVCVDNIHGATRGRIQRIIGESDKVRYLRTEDDVLFGGIAPEPSSENMEEVEDVLLRSNARFKLGVLMDPDGDRIRHTDGRMQIPMNYFGAMAFHFLHVHKGFQGVAVKSVGTSNLVNAIAERHGVPVIETKVGFKHFRPYMRKDASQRAVVVFEESDGISGYNHTLEKDAIFGLLLAIEMIAVTEKNLSEYLHKLMDDYGYYYPDRSGIEVDRGLTGDVLHRKLSVIREKYKKGASIDINGKRLRIKEIITTDGTKLVLEDGSWLMIRPSGTEPKVRFYIEARTEDGKKAVFETAERITREALDIR